MKEMSVKSVNSNMYSVEDNRFPKPVYSRKPHRTVVRGVKLLSEMLRTVEPNIDFTNFPLLEQEHELPHDVFTCEILARLPIKCLLRLMSVSKQWYSTVSSYEFANVHFRNRLSSYDPSSPVECLFIQVGSKFYLFHIQADAVVLDYCLVKLEPNFDTLAGIDIHLVGSCNGLVCVADSSPSADHFYIWNPVSYLSRKFSSPCFMSCQSIVSWGFAYVSSVDDYKVLKIVQDYDTLETIILVFSFRTQEWKRIHDHGLDQSLLLTKSSPGLLVRETLYWTMVTRVPSTKYVVVGFNFALEKFEEVPGLVPKEISISSEHFLCVTGGCLSMYSLNVHYDEILSILKRPDQEVETITISSYSGKRSCNSGLVGFTRTGKCLVVSKASELAQIDLNSSPKQYSPLVNFEQGHKPCMVSYVPSLISPFAITDP